MAEASDSASIREYSLQLVASLVPERAGPTYIESLARRLARAEQLARQGRGLLVPEAAIARAFNDLMKRVGAPPSIHADEAALRKFRAHAISVRVVPAILTAGRNGSNCTPSESVYLLNLLLSEDGSIKDSDLDLMQALANPRPMQPPPDGRWASAIVALTPAVAPNKSASPPQTAAEFLSSYSEKHRRHAIIKLMNGIAQALEF